MNCLKKIRRYTKVASVDDWIAVAVCTCGLGLTVRRFGLRLRIGGAIGALVGISVAAVMEYFQTTWVSFILVPIYYWIAFRTIPIAESTLAKYWGPVKYQNHGKEKVVRNYPIVNIDDAIPMLIAGLAAHYFHSIWWVAAVGITIIYLAVSAWKPWFAEKAKKTLARRYPLDILADCFIKMIIAIVIFEAICWFFIMLIRDAR